MAATDTFESMTLVEHGSSFLCLMLEMETTEAWSDWSQIRLTFASLWIIPTGHRPYQNTAITNGSSVRSIPFTQARGFFLKDSLLELEMELIISSKQRELYKHYFKMNRPWLFVAGCPHFGFKSTRFHKALVCCPPQAFPSLTVNLGSLAVMAGLTR